MLAVNQLTLQLNERSIIQDISFTVPAGGILSIIGQSGAGKTTVLRCLAGLEACTGTVHWQQQRLDQLTPQQRQCGFIEQQSTLFPHLTVRDNVAYPLRLRRVDKKTAQREAEVLLRDCGISQCADRLPHQISGGEGHRAMLARALIYQPAVLLCDEPFAAVDTMTRVDLVAWFKKLISQHQTTVLYVTHDLAEAQTVSQQALVLDHGQQLTCGSWSELERHSSPLVQQLLNKHF